MAITSKELAERFFQQAVALEKAEKAKQGKPQLDVVLKLYEEAIVLNPNHIAARNNLTCLRLEAKTNFSRKEIHLKDAVAEPPQKRARISEKKPEENVVSQKLTLFQQRNPAAFYSPSVLSKHLSSQSIQGPNPLIILCALMAAEHYTPSILAVPHEAETSDDFSNSVSMKR